MTAPLFNRGPRQLPAYLAHDNVLDVPLRFSKSANAQDYLKGLPAVANLKDGRRLGDRVRGRAPPPTKRPNGASGESRSAGFLGFVVLISWPARRRSLEIRVNALSVTRAARPRWNACEGLSTMKARPKRV